MTRNFLTVARSSLAALLVALATATTASADFFDDFDQDFQLSDYYQFWGAGMVPIIPGGGNPVGFLNEAASGVDSIDWNFSGDGYTTTATGSPPDTFFPDSTFTLLPLESRVNVVTAGGQVGHGNFQNLIRDLDDGFFTDGIGSHFEIGSGITLTTKVTDIPVQGYSSVGAGPPQLAVGIGLRQYLPNPPINGEFVMLVGQEDFSNALVQATYNGAVLPNGSNGADAIIVPDLNLSDVEATIEFYVDDTNYSLSVTGQDANTFLEKTVQVIPLTPHGISLDLSGVSTPYMTARRWSGIEDVDVYFNSFGGVAGIVQPPALTADFDMDGDVDGNDFLVWQRNTAVGNLSDWQAEYGMSAPPLASAVGAVPEPSSMILLGMAALGLCGSRRRK